jgi:hypothetical protein
MKSSCIHIGNVGGVSGRKVGQRLGSNTNLSLQQEGGADREEQSKPSSQIYRKKE